MNESMFNDPLPNRTRELVNGISNWVLAVTEFSRRRFEVGKRVQDRSTPT